MNIVSENPETSGKGSYFAIWEKINALVKNNNYNLIEDREKIVCNQENKIK